MQSESQTISNHAAKAGQSAASVSLAPALNTHDGLPARLARFAGACINTFRHILSRLMQIRRTCFGFTRENRWVFLVALLLLIPAWVKGINLLLLLALLVVAMWGVNLVVAGRQVRRLKCSRIWHGPVYAGRETHWDIEVRNNDSRRATGFRVVDGGPDHHQEWFIDRLDERQAIRLHASIVLPRRGPYVLDPLMASSLYPFGVAHRRRWAGPRDECLVLPRLGRLNVKRFEHWLAQRAGGDTHLHRTARPSMLHQDDLHGLRPFRAGDNPRWIHWRTSARKNQKMIREFEQETGQELILLLEPYSSNPDQYDPRLEAAVSLAATICWEWRRVGGDRLQLGIFGPKPIVTSRVTAGDSALELLRTLAMTVGASSIDPAPLMKRLAAPASRTTPVVLVTSLVNSPTVARLSKTWNRPVYALNAETARDFYEESASVG